ncbi:hypothetical protein [Maridesulfovibrio ferrireducens]|uniref:hypothetical protein n=1 Tax=Maridesulfovibrio ferrireducens TaxID=246191 RepID=UPI001A2B2959|nr:hypothetical protein [Maridesulfovibrio ferrireducens]MBI9110275.1 hypothetical protein [Maridesulfovibrio ferrireducens]
MTNAELAVYAAAASGACAVLTAIFPEPENPKGKKIWQVMNYVGGNFRHAKNLGKIEKDKK